jgi:hypothetical protein
LIIFTISAAGDNFIHAPAVGVTHIHIFDEAQDVAFFTEEACHGKDTVFVDAALHDHVYFDRAKPTAAAASMPSITFSTGNPHRSWI